MLALLNTLVVDPKGNQSDSATDSKESDRAACVDVYSTANHQHEHAEYDKGDQAAAAEARASNTPACCCGRTNTCWSESGSR